MSKDTESQHSEASPQPTPGPWTRLLLAAHAVLEPWDGGVLFDENPPTVAEVMNALAAATAATDLQEAAKADAAPDLAKRLEFAEMLLDGGQIQVNGTPWREAWAKMQELVGRQP